MAIEIDRDAVNQLHELGGNEFVIELIDTFLEHTPTLMDDGKTALAENNAKNFERAFHSMKSSAASLGAGQLRELAFELEILGNDGDISSAAPKIASLAPVFADTCAALEALKVEYGH